ncbi:Protein of unknown function [Gryllus bimaculatus]|nr:Protein of unknown function [Gryllus bimaculatus]
MKMISATREGSSPAARLVGGEEVSDSMNLQGGRVRDGWGVGSGGPEEVGVLVRIGSGGRGAFPGREAGGFRGGRGGFRGGEGGGFRRGRGGFRGGEGGGFRGGRGGSKDVEGGGFSGGRGGLKDEEGDGFRRGRGGFRGGEGGGFRRGRGGFRGGEGGGFRGGRGGFRGGEGGGFRRGHGGFRGGEGGFRGRRGGFKDGEGGGFRGGRGGFREGKGGGFGKIEFRERRDGVSKWDKEAVMNKVDGLIGDKREEKVFADFPEWSANSIHEMLISLEDDLNRIPKMCQRYCGDSCRKMLPNVKGWQPAQFKSVWDELVKKLEPPTFQNILDYIKRFLVRKQPKPIPPKLRSQVPRLFRRPQREFQQMENIPKQSRSGNVCR